MNKMKRKGILKRLALCAVSLTMLASATACGKPQDSGEKIAVICKNDKVSFWDEVKKGAGDCCDEMGYEMLYYCAEGDNDFASQIEDINDAINKNAKAIVIAPNDLAELNETLEKANNKGIKIVYINSKANFDGAVSYVGSQDFDGGAVAARNAARIMFSTATESGAYIGKVAIIGHTASTADLRITGFKATFSSSLGQYIAKMRAQAAAAAESSGSGIPGEAVPSQGSAAQGGAAQGGTAQGGAAQGAAAGNAQGGASAATGDSGSGAKTMTAEEQQAMIASFFIDGQRCATQEAAYEEAKKILENNKDIKVFYATNTNTTLGVCQAVEESDLSDTITVVGFNSDEQELKYIRTGVLDGTIIQNPYNMGYIGVRYAIQSANGEGVAGNLDTGVTWISAKNINDDDIQLLLYPEKA